MKYPVFFILVGLPLIFCLANCGDPSVFDGREENPASNDQSAVDAGVSDDGGMVAPGSDAGFPDQRVKPKEFPEAPPFTDLGPNRRLQDLENLKDQELRDELYALVKGHTVISYAKAKLAMYVDGLDVHNGEIECLYTGLTTKATGVVDPGDINTEHTWPQSDGANGTAASDLHHLFPSNRVVNSRRSSLDFGYTACPSKDGSCRWEMGGSSQGDDNYGQGLVFQVREKRQGDVARAHFYFAVRYKRNIPATEERVLRVWNRVDPPDDWERERTTKIEALQKTRNPFVDRYDFVDKISDF